MKQWSKYVLLIPMLVGMFLPARAQEPVQDKEALKKQRQELLKSIDVTQRLLSQAGEKQKQSLNYLRLLDRKVSQRRRLIANIKQEIRLTTQDINESSSVVVALQEDLRLLKEQYAELIRYAYRNREGQDWLLYLFSSESFFQMYERMRYLRYYSRFRVRQLEIIEQTRASLTDQLESLRRRREEKEQLLTQLNQEVSQLVRDRKTQAQTVANLKERQSELQGQLEEDRARAADLQKAIEDILARELRKRREEERRRSEADRKATAARAELSASFASNQGRLPWPVKEGVVSGEFGIHEHPTLRGVELKNNGVDITVEQDATAYAVFGGKVLAVFAIPGSGEGVLVKHGDYFTLYSNLKKVFVKTGDEIELRQAVGVISTNPQTGATELHFEIYRESEVQNPRSWIKNM